MWDQALTRRLAYHLGTSAPEAQKPIIKKNFDGWPRTCNGTWFTAWGPLPLMPRNQ